MVLSGGVWMSRYNSQTRILLIFMMLENKIKFSKRDLENLFEVNYRTIDRDLSVIRNALSEAKTFDYFIKTGELVFDKNKNIYQLLDNDLIQDYEDDEKENEEW